MVSLRVNKSIIKRAYISDLVSALESKSRIRISLQYNEGYYYKVQVISEHEREQFPIFINEITYEIVYRLLSPNACLMQYGRWSFNKLKCTDNIVEIKRMSRIKLMTRKAPIANQLVVIL